MSKCDTCFWQENGCYQDKENSDRCYQDKEANTARLFFHLILKAQYKDTRWQGYDIPRGCVVTSFKRLEEELGLSTQNLRTAIKHLIKSENIENLTCEITNIKKANFTIYKVNNYDYFQGGNKQDNKQLTNSQQTPNKQLTTYKKDKKLRKLVGERP